MTEELIVATAKRSQLPISSVRAVITLHEQDATVPFIARYRKAQTGGLDETDIRNILKTYEICQELASRKQTILSTIQQQGKLTPELEKQITQCDDLTVLEDLYLPYKPKRKTKASIAIEQGLAPLAEIIKTAKTGNPEELIDPFLQGDICTKKEAITGAQYIIAEEIAENAVFRSFMREQFHKHGIASAKKKKTDHKDAFKFDLYEDFSISVTKIKPHQTLALLRGEELGILSVSFTVDESMTEQFVELTQKVSPKLLFYEQYKQAIKLGINRYLAPSLEREIRQHLKEIADIHAIHVFSENLKKLLMQPPLFDKVVMGIDPGFSSGCKVCVIDKQGNYLKGDVIYPVPPRNAILESEQVLLNFIERYQVDVIAIGNGTASRETEQFIANFIKKFKLKTKYII
ncbi:MAG: RNA-binding transcriptional accessory protein, partial [Bacteroidia bacterium]|nr:RNA-binding transcriptional accessory protein [Bacteroidia bacterium]